MTDEEPVEEKPNEARNGSEEAILEVEHNEIIEEVDPVKALTDELTQTKAQAAEYLDGWQRARAEFANYKRRTETERAELLVSAGADVLIRILPAADDFDRAVQTLPADLKDNAWVAGVMLVQRKLANGLDSSGVKPIPVQPGDTFDPNIHEAVTQEDSEQFASGQIIGEVQHGYKMGERVLRPAMVRVAR